MFTMRLLGALAIIVGVVWLAVAALSRGRLSDPADNPNDATAHTLEPRHRGVAFLGAKTSWPGHALIVLGIVLLLLPALVAPVE